jgi:hypothetical protein
MHDMRSVAVKNPLKLSPITVTHGRWNSAGFYRLQPRATGVEGDNHHVKEGPRQLLRADLNCLLGPSNSELARNFHDPY